MSLLRDGAFYLSICLAAIFFLYGSEPLDLLKDRSLEELSGGSGVWLTEGAEASAAAGPGVGLKGTGQGFLYQGFTIGASHGRKMGITASAWVWSQAPGSAFIEISDRKGNDFRSAAHPGDGSWRLLALTLGAPAVADALEFRFRAAGQGNFIKEASVVPGQVPGLKDHAGSVPGADSFMRLMAVIASPAAFALFALAAGRGRSIGDRGMAAAFTLLLASALMLVAGRDANAWATASISWALLCAAALIFALDSPVFAPVAAAMRRPGSLFAAITVAMLVVSVNALRTGDAGEAELAASAAYVSMLCSALSILARKAARRRIAVPARITFEKRPEAAQAAVTEETRRAHEGCSCQAELS